MTKRLLSKQRRKVRQRAILISGVGGDIQFADQAARLWLKQFFGRPKRSGFLPRQVHRWISKPARNGRSLVAKTATAQLYLKREPSYTEDNLVLLFELIKGKSEAAGTANSRHANAKSSFGSPVANQILKLEQSSRFHHLL